MLIHVSSFIFTNYNVYAYLMLYYDLCYIYVHVDINVTGIVSGRPPVRRYIH